MSKEPDLPKDTQKSPVVKTVTPVEFKVKDVVRRCGKGTALEKQHNYDQVVETLQFLYVKVVRAQNLAAKGADRTSGPYVKVSVLEVSAQTEVIPKDLNPEWNRVFAFSKDTLRGQFLDISLWDADGDGAHHFLGALSFLLEEIPSRKPPESLPAPLWYKLEERPGKTGVQGDLMTALWMGTQADEALLDAWYPDTSGHAYLRSKVYRTPNLWYLRVSIIEAKGLCKGDDHAHRQLEPYRQLEPIVGINLGPVQTKRLILDSAKGTHPVWNKDLIFVAAEPFDELVVVTVTDRVGPSKEEVIGVARIPISEVPQRLDFGQQVNSSWYDLEATYKGVSRGRIHLRLQFEGGYHVLDEFPGYSSCVKPSAEKLCKPAQGTLELGVIGARNLLPMQNNAGGRPVTDAYCVAKYGQKWFRTSTITDDDSPRWNEQHTWEVYDPCSVITIGVFQNRRFHNGSEATARNGVKDTPIGKLRIRLSSLETGRAYANAYPLIIVTPTGIKKMGELELSVRFSFASTVSVLRAYLQPPLPAMHYYLPIDSSDMEGLRIGAMNLVASSLARFEHPLRQEVVRYILDADFSRWTMRRSKANYFRIANVLGGLFGFHCYFESVCSWKNPKTTVLYHIFFLLLVWHLELLLPFVFLMLFLVGMWNYKYRPRDPPVIDSQLSQGGEEPIRDFDELEEEFNIETPNKDLINRYLKLRGFAGSMQYAVGKVCNQAERLKSLFTWEDPRASFMFVTFCLIAAIVHYVMPLLTRMLIVFFVLRHPRFRNPSPWPSTALTFFRRLPCLEDRIL